MTYFGKYLRPTAVVVCACILLARTAGAAGQTCSTPESSADNLSDGWFSFYISGNAPGTCDPEVYLDVDESPTGGTSRIVEYYPCTGVHTETDVPGISTFVALQGMCGAAWVNQFVYGNGSQQSSRPLPRASVSAAPPSGQGSQQVASGDFNGDGNPDSASIGSAGVVVQLTASDGSVISSHTYPVGFSTSNALASNVIAADFNGDGKLDLAVSNYGNPGATPGGIAILLGTGDGTFGAPIAVSAGTNPLSMAAADFNGDGKLDIAAANQWSAASNSTFPGPGTISVLFGNGDGTFGVPATYPTGEDQIGLPDSLIALDLNGDGVPDLAVANRNDNSISTWINSGGKFKSPLVTPLPAGIEYLAYTDFNHDGKLDVIAAAQHSSAVVMLLGNGSGGFQTPAVYAAGNQPASIGVGPLEDGNTLAVTADDITGNTWVTVVSPQGAVGSPPVAFLGGSPTGVAAVDLNGDGQPDAAAVGGSNEVAVVLSTGHGYQAPVGYSLGGVSPQAVAIGDMNGDGKPDVVTANGAGSVSVLLGNGDGTLQTAITTNSNVNPSGLTLADFNGDGKLDAALAAYSISTTTTDGGVAILLGDGNGSLQPPVNLTVSGLHPEAIASADLNGDGIPDLAVVAVGTPGQPATLVIFLGQDGGKFQDAQTFPLKTAGGSQSGIAIGDLNGDGKPDIVAYSYYGTQMDVLLGNGKGGFQEASNSPTTSAANAAALALADVNGDGKLDIVTTGSFLLGNGDGTFQAEQQFLAASFTTQVAPTKFSGSTLLISVGQAGTMVATALRAAVVSPLTITSNVSAANPALTTPAPSSIATAYGSDLATAVASAGTGALPTTLGKTTVTITDSTGAQFAAPLFYVSPTQVNYEVPAATASGDAQVTIENGNGNVGSANVQITSVAPGVFMLNEAGLVAADAIVISNGTQQVQNVYQVSGGAIVALPVNVSAGQVYLAIYATGLRNAKSVKAMVGGQSVPVLFWGAQGGDVGLDQVNIGPLPVSLQGQVNITLIADEQTANTVNVTIQ